ncbi:hypothetical protein Tco_0068072, partial [Tanacetum coccineum]
MRHPQPATAATMAERTKSNGGCGGGRSVVRLVVHARWWQRLGDGDDGGSADGRSREVVVLGGLWHGCWCGGASV